MLAPFVKNKSLHPVIPFCIALRGVQSNDILSSSCFILIAFLSCRKKDSTMSHTAPLILEQTPPASPFSANFSVDDLPIRDILPRRSPTARRPRSLARSDTSRDEDGDSSHDRTVRDSEASRYLRQFQSSASLSDVRTNGCRSEAQRSYSSTTMNTTPSLSFSHTPTSSTCASVAHSFSNNSTLHPRTTPQSTSLSTRGLDLVLPATVYPASSQPSTPSGFSKAEATATATSLSTAPLQSASATKSLPAMAKPSDDVAADALLTYPKQWPLPTPWEPGSPGAAGSLKQLFCWSDMETSASIKRPVWGSTGDLQGFW